VRSTALYAQHIIVGALSGFYLLLIEKSDQTNRGCRLGSLKENIMSKFIVAGAAAASIILGASSAYALPPNSPYAIWIPQSVDQGFPASNGAFGGSNSDATGSSSFPARRPGATSEGRAAFVSGDPDANGMTIETPEDRTYYSRGR
jgi:hypothetical protein